MLRLPPFTYLQPRTLGEAVRLLAEQPPGEAMAVAGGTDLYPNMKRRQFEPKYLVGLRRLPELRFLHGDARQGLTIGAGMTLTEVSTHPQVRQGYPALATAAGLVSTPQLRNMGTIGGNLCLDTRCNYYNQTYWWRQAIGFCLKKDGDTCWVAPGSRRCWAVASSDTAPVLLALQAQVTLLGPQGERTLPLAALYRDDGIAYLNKGHAEILTRITVPPAEGLRMAYVKLRRRGAFDFPVLGVAVALRLADDGTCTEARLALGAVASAPLLATEAAALLQGNRLTPEVIEAAAAAAFRPARPLDNTDLTLAYRKKMVRVHVARTLYQLAGLAAPAAL
ncbi:MAG: FAD-binding molybdopterin dehydrogenase [Candidatus Tectimicrobiota bacterium]|nr:MAG: FAD-binding molybdopterin dehydrogenase [Candidatus Tectomicrobia bacterium]